MGQIRDFLKRDFSTFWLIEPGFVPFRTSLTQDWPKSDTPGEFDICTKIIQVNTLTTGIQIIRKVIVVGKRTWEGEFQLVQSKANIFVYIK